MEESKASAAAMAQQQLMNQQQQQQQQQMLFLQQQLQRQKQQDAIMSRFPSNIDAHLRPQQHLVHRSQSPNSNPNPNSTRQVSSAANHHQTPNAITATATATSATTIATANHNPNNNNNNTNNTTTINNKNNINNNSTSSNPQQLQKVNRANSAELQMAYQDAWWVCHPDFKRPFSSLEDACERFIFVLKSSNTQHQALHAFQKSQCKSRLLLYHVVADYEAEEDDKILDSDTTGQMLSRSQQWDHNIAAKVAEFTATFEKQVLAFNMISRKRDLGEFRTEEKLMIEQLLLQEERRAFLELRAEMDTKEKAARETQESNLRMAALVHT